MERKKSAGVGCLYAQRRMYARNAASNRAVSARRSEEHTSELQSRLHLVCRLLLEKKKNSGFNKRVPGALDLRSTCAPPNSFSEPILHDQSRFNESSATPRYALLALLSYSTNCVAY